MSLLQLLEHVLKQSEAVMFEPRGNMQQAEEQTDSLEKEKLSLELQHIQGLVDALQSINTDLSELETQGTKQMEVVCQCTVV